MHSEDVLRDSINLFGDAELEDDRIVYGPLVLTTAPKVSPSTRTGSSPRPLTPPRRKAR